MVNVRQKKTEIDEVEVSEIDPLDNIYVRKQRRYTLITLGFLLCASVIFSVIAYMQGVLTRQVVNTSVSVVLLASMIIFYRHKGLIRWPTYLAVLFLHLLITSGFITNGGVEFYAASALPVVPLITALLLGQYAALYSLVYVLFLSVISGILITYGIHPPNITALEHQTTFGVIFTNIAILCAFIGFYSLMATTKLSEMEVKKYTTKLEDEIKARLRAEQVVRDASLEKTQFLSAVSHELRTPLNSIIGFTQRLKNLELTDRGIVCANQITTSSEDLLKKVNDLLSFTELLLDKSTIELSSLVIGDLFDFFRNSFLDKGGNNNTLIFDCDSTSSQVVITDVDKVRKIISNIIENALKFTNDGEVVVRASIHSDATDTVLVCDITDSGIGIDESKIDRLFDAFTQHDMSSSRSYEGIGLGLASSYSLTSLLGGCLMAKNNPGKGCTFSLRIPVTLQWSAK